MALASTATNAVRLLLVFPRANARAAALKRSAPKTGKAHCNKVLSPVVCNGSCKYSNQCRATSAGFSKSQCKRRSIQKKGGRNNRRFRAKTKRRDPCLKFKKRVSRSSKCSTGYRKCKALSRTVTRKLRKLKGVCSGHCRSTCVKQPAKKSCIQKCRSRCERSYKKRSRVSFGNIENLLVGLFSGGINQGNVAAIVIYNTGMAST